MPNEGEDSPMRTNTLLNCPSAVPEPETQQKKGNDKTHPELLHSQAEPPVDHVVIRGAAPGRFLEVETGQPGAGLSEGRYPLHPPKLAVLPPHVHLLAGHR